ncbi:MAG TPA: complex I NDUFA9 subunit family protein [Caulobacteraceae bacterium]|nr:complex I NDUFA9 subunit family protein [Caulobacteraceae bacterium]
MRGLVTLFGGSGFVGQHAVRALARRGWRIRVAVRRPWRAYRLRLLGDVGQIEIVQANLRDRPSVAAALEGAEACVNAVGVLYEAGPQRFEALHAAGAGAVAEAAARAGVLRFVQISAIGADPGSPARYARTKAAGEAAARAALPQAVILRPSVVFGPEDRFFNRFAEMALVSPALPLVGGGKTRFQPVFVDDVARAVAAALADAASAGRTYELGGPGVYTFRELMQLTLREIGRRRLLVPLPWGLAQILGAGGDAVAALHGAAAIVPAPPLTTDQVALLRCDNVVAEAAAGLVDLGVAPTALEPIVPTYLYRFRNGGQYAQALEAQA